MTDPVVRIEPTLLVLEPGGQARTTVFVRNVGTIVEGFGLTVLGDAAGWAEVVPAEVPVYPGQEGSAVVVFSAPEGTAAPTGTLPFGVLAASLVDRSRSATAEGDLEIGRVHGLSASITPVTSTGRWSGRHAVQIRNWGNAPAVLRLSASDPDELLGFLVHPQRVEVPVGGAATAAVRVRSRRPFLRGTPVRLPFTVVAEPDPPDWAPSPAPATADPKRPVLNGALAQKPVLSRGTVAVAVLAAAAVAGAAVVAARYQATPEFEQAVDAAAISPAGLAATPVDAAVIRLNWEPVERAPDAYRLFQVDPTTLDDRVPATQDEKPVPGSVAVFLATGLTAATEYCFQLSAVRGETQSRRSPASCATTAAAPVPTPTPTQPPGPTTAVTTPPTATTPTTPTTPDTGASATAAPATPGPPTPGGGAPAQPDLKPSDWILVWPFPAADPGAPVLKERKRQELERGGHEVHELDSVDYPDLFTRPSAVLYIGPFGTEQEARGYCAEKNPPQCTPRRVGPKR